MSDLPQVTSFSVSFGTAGSSSDAIPKTSTSLKNAWDWPPPWDLVREAAPDSPLRDECQGPSFLEIVAEALREAVEEAVAQEEAEATAAAAMVAKTLSKPSGLANPDEKLAQGPIQSGPTKRKMLVIKIKSILSKSQKALRFIKKAKKTKVTEGSRTAKNDQNPAATQSPPNPTRLPPPPQVLPQLPRPFGMCSRPAPPKLDLSLLGLDIPELQDWTGEDTVSHWERGQHQLRANSPTAFFAGPPPPLVQLLPSLPRRTRGPMERPPSHRRRTAG